MTALSFPHPLGEGPGMRLLMIMLKTYFKQALALFRQNRLFSTLYIAGTGLAIAMTVVMALVTT